MVKISGVWRVPFLKLIGHESYLRLRAAALRVYLNDPAAGASGPSGPARQAPPADPELFLILNSFLAALKGRTEDEQDAAEMLAVLRMLHALGVDAGDTFGASDDYSDQALARAHDERSALIVRINHGISSSGL